MVRKELLEKGLDRAKEIQQAISDLEVYEGIIEVARLGKVCFVTNGCTTEIDKMLSTEKMAELKENVLKSMQETDNAKLREYKNLIGVVDIFIQIEDQHGKDKVKEVVNMSGETPKVELTVRLVKSLYHDENMTLEAMSKQLGVPKSTIHTFITKNDLKKPSKKEQALYNDSKVEQAKPR